jgi:hypothetical protein
LEEQAKDLLVAFEEQKALTPEIEEQLKSTIASWNDTFSAM